MGGEGTHSSVHLNWPFAKPQHITISQLHFKHSLRVCYSRGLCTQQVADSLLYTNSNMEKGIAFLRNFDAGDTCPLMRDSVLSDNPNV